MNESTIMELIKTLNMLSEKCIQFDVHLVDGWFPLKPDEVIKYLQDPDSLAAKKHDVTAEHFRAWRDFEKDPHCYGMTRKNKPCKNTVWCGTNVHAFIPGVSEYCKVHQQHTPQKGGAA